jgi:hypothetical protein
VRIKQANIYAWSYKPRLCCSGGKLPRRKSNCSTARPAVDALLLLDRAGDRSARGRRSARLWVMASVSPLPRVTSHPVAQRAGTRTRAVLCVQWFVRTGLALLMTTVSCSSFRLCLPSMIVTAGSG